MSQAQTEQRITAIVADARLLRLGPKEIARRAGLDEMTVSRTLKRHTRPLSETIDKIESVIAAHKTELRKALDGGGADELHETGAQATGTAA